MGNNFDNAMQEKVNGTKLRLFLDMDGTLFHWNNVVLSAYSEDANKDEYERILDILYGKSYYKDLAPYDNMIEAVKILIDEGIVDVYICSCVLKDREHPDQIDPNCAADKKAALQKAFGDRIPDDHIIFAMDGTDKRLYIPGGVKPTDTLIDDNTARNLRVWTEKGMAIKILNGVNSTKGTWRGPSISVADSPEKIAKDIKAVMLYNQLVIAEKPPRDITVYDPEVLKILSMDEKDAVKYISDFLKRVAEKEVTSAPPMNKQELVSFSRDIYHNASLYKDTVSLDELALTACDVYEEMIMTKTEEDEIDYE